MGGVDRVDARCETAAPVKGKRKLWKLQFVCERFSERIDGTGDAVGVEIRNCHSAG